jgi:hypothetical protein
VLAEWYTKQDGHDDRARLAAGWVAPGVGAPILLQHTKITRRYDPSNVIQLFQELITIEAPDRLRQQGLPDCATTTRAARGGSPDP